MWLMGESTELVVLSVVICCVSILVLLRVKPTKAQKHALQFLLSETKVPFDRALHEARLDAFALRHNVTDYRRIGFQREASPITDFRGFGILTLDVMEQSALVEAYDQRLGYGLTMINVGHEMLLRMAQSGRFLRRFDVGMSSKDGDVIVAFAAWVDKEMLGFAAYWEKHGADIMAFNQCLTEYARRW